jgi:hypothetical protein
MADTFALMSDGTYYGMTNEQEIDARKHRVRTIPCDDGTWGWSADFGESFGGYESELEAWSRALDAMEDFYNAAD